MRGAPVVGKTLPLFARSISPETELTNPEYKSLYIFTQFLMNESREACFQLIIVVAEDFVQFRPVTFFREKNSYYH